ncbi:MAG: flavin reductase family protein [Thermoleophilia bacterium]|jgi:flavin reductase (DIM6/NTAB) family NADH-FMN oxidoreductase RutF
MSTKKSLGANTIAFPTPAWAVATYDSEGKPNAMTIAWGGICCSKPPCVAISLRKATYTYDAISARQSFTINIPSASQVKALDFFGVNSGKNVDKFAATGLTPVKSGLVDAPFIDEFPVVLECRVLHTLEIGLHTQFVGEIVDVKADESLISDGGLDIDAIRPLAFIPQNREYRVIGEVLGKAFSIGREKKDS